MSFKIGQYYPTQSFLHSLDPRVKLILLPFLMAVVLMAKDVISVLAVFVLSLLHLLLAKIPLKYLAKSLKTLSFLLFFAFFFNLFFGDGIVLLDLGLVKIREDALINASLIAFRLLFLVLNTTLFISLSISPIRLTAAIESLFAPLARLGFPAHDFALMMSIALRFVPTLFIETEKLIKAQSARGANYDAGPFWKKIRAMLTVIIPLFLTSMERADDLAFAMQARCYNGGEGKTSLYPLIYQKQDYVFLALSLLSYLLIISYRLFLV